MDTVEKSLRDLFKRNKIIDKLTIKKEVNKNLLWAQENDNKIITFFCEEYPELLRNINNPPPVLFIKGEVKNLQKPQIAIVGSRKNTLTGANNSYQFAKQLSKLGIIITSGLALGVDSWAHKGAISKTIAVLGHDLSFIYPHKHIGLAKEIVKLKGTLVSEFPLDYPLQKSNFPRRNRIISGLSLGVLVVEAKLRSGSLITAYQALEQGREVFALPGAINDVMSFGCNKLIQQGAKLVLSIDDILDEIGWGL